MKLLKNLSFLILLISIFFVDVANAQEAPKTFTFQGIARQDGFFLKDLELGFEVSLFTDYDSLVYMEAHTAETNKEGVFTLFIGEGTSPTADFEDIDWGNFAYYLNVRVFYKGNFYFEMPNVPILAVPVANFAHHAHSTDDWTNVGDTILYRLQGRVGIGTDMPTAKLEVVPDIRAEYLELHGDGERLGLTNAGETADYQFSVLADGRLNLRESISGNQYFTFTPSGDAGLFTNSPQADFHINGITRSNAFETFGTGARLTMGNPSESRVYQFRTALSGDLGLFESTQSRHFLHFDNNGRVGVLNDNPQADFHINGTTRSNAFETFGNGTRLMIGNATQSRLYRFTTASNGELSLYESTQNRYFLHFDNAGRVGVFTTNPQAELDVNGRIRTRELEIVGGMDITEPFEMTEARPIEKGALVAIDPENPGKLTQSAKAYDKCIAGIISGAGGIHPGMSLSQGDLVENGQLVALTGRVYVKASACNGAIQAGDLLTSSDLPGIAMKVTDHQKAFGAVIGKAMTELEAGEGLVLVLVNLQ